jgi:hypothetical protein
VALTAAVELSAARLQHPALWEVRVRLHNAGGEPVRFSTATMLAPVSFQVAGLDGRAVPLGPPPVPPSDLAAGLTTLGAGESLELRFAGDELLPDAPPPGRYRLRFIARVPAVQGAWSGTIESPWVEFDAPG